MGRIRFHTRGHAPNLDSMSNQKNTSTPERERELMQEVLDVSRRLGEVQRELHELRKTTLVMWSARVPQYVADAVKREADAAGESLQTVTTTALGMWLDERESQDDA